MKDTIESGHLLGFLILLVISAIVLFIARRKGFFKLPEKKIEKQLSWIHVVSLFGSILLFVFVVIPVVYWIMSRMYPQLITEHKKGVYLQNSVQIVVAIWLLIYLWLLSPSVRSYIFFGHRKPTYSNQMKSAGMGILALMIGYPVSMVVTLIVNWIVLKTFGEHGVEQVAVEYLKNSVSDLGLFLITLFIVAFVVPFFEEFIFRGVLQNWLKKFMSQFGAIVLTSAIFASVHFSIKQGIGNLELIFTLFVLSCFLGFIYERQQQFIAPYVFHGAYNGFNALMVYIELSHGI